MLMLPSTHHIWSNVECVGGSVSLKEVNRGDGLVDRAACVHPHKHIQHAPLHQVSIHDVLLIAMVTVVLENLTSQQTTEIKSILNFKHTVLGTHISAIWAVCLGQ